MIEVIWHGARDWGVESYRDSESGMLYRRARARETAHLVTASKFGEVKLRRLNRRELASLEDAQRPTLRQRRVP